MKSHLFQVLLTGGIVMAARPLHAESFAVAVANPSFEAFYIEPGAYRTGDISDWQREGGTRNQVGVQSVAPAMFPLQPGPGGEIPNVLPAPADGPQFAFINPSSDSSPIALWQVLEPLRAHTRYTFTVAVGNRLDKTYPDKLLLELRNGDGPNGFILAAASNATGPDNGAFADHSVSFETGPYVMGNLVIVIRNPGGSQIVVDNVRVTMESTR